MTDHSKPVLDEQTFQKLLAAAFVVQEHRQKMQALEESLESQSEQLEQQALASQAFPPDDHAASAVHPNSDYTLILAEIVEAQRQIQLRHLELDQALAVVAESVVRITGAGGAGIGILEGAMVRYAAASGTLALPASSKVPLTQAICRPSVREGQIIRVEDVNAESRFDPELCRQRGIRSLIAVPIYRDGQVLGALELYFDRIRGFVEQDIHTCQLMAGLVTEAIGRDVELKLKTSMAAERSTMLAAIEKLQPNLAAWAEDKFGANAEPAKTASVDAPPKSPCWKCGSPVTTEEPFCGGCGAARAADGEEPTLQSKVASAWHTQQANQPPSLKPAADWLNITKAITEQAKQSSPLSAYADASHSYEIHPSLDSMADHFLQSLPELEEPADPFDHPLPSNEAQDSFTEEPSPPPLAEVDAKNVDTRSDAPLALSRREDVVWSSAGKAKNFLDSLLTTRTSSGLARFWRFRRGDIYLAVAVILVVVVLTWGFLSNHSAGASARGSSAARSANRRKRPAPENDLSAFDQLLIGLGLAEAPEAPEYKGNPDTQVWVDLNTALYYCPGSDLYAKTTKGRLSSQRDAQLDQFEPAYRKACD